MGLDSPLVLTFSQDISRHLDWSKGKICVLDYDSQRSVLEVGADKFAQLGGYIEGNKLVIPSAFKTDWILFSVSGKMSVIIPNGLVTTRVAYGEGPVGYSGIQKRDGLTFTLKRNVITTGFDLQEDRFNFNNTSDYFDKRYYFRASDKARLFNSIGNGSKLLVYYDLLKGEKRNLKECVMVWRL